MCLLGVVSDSSFMGHGSTMGWDRTRFRGFLTQTAEVEVRSQCMSYMHFVQSELTLSHPPERRCTEAAFTHIYHHSQKVVVLCAGLKHSVPRKCSSKCVRPLYITSTSKRFFRAGTIMICIQRAALHNVQNIEISFISSHLNGIRIVSTPGPDRSLSQRRTLFILCSHDLCEPSIPAFFHLWA